jgi:hypothetical protein
MIPSILKCVVYDARDCMLSLGYWHVLGIVVCAYNL